MKNKQIRLLLSVLFISTAIHAQNPFISHMYTADPSARVFNDTLYVYPSHDPDTATWFNMVDWPVFSTTDLKNWKDHGVILSLDDLSWATKYAWAPDCENYNGKYYFYFPTDQNYIGVAVGDHPTGPFHDPLGKPLITRETPGVVATRDLIDPCIFIDDDQTPYLYFGQNDVNVVELNEDMISLKEEVRVVKGTKDFFEAVWVHKRNGIYYLSYSGREKILYATSDSPYGPFKYQGEILGKMNSVTNHHSIVKYKGNWYLFYHNADLFLDTKLSEEEKEFRYFRRSIAADRLYYHKDGTIKKVIPTRQGVEAVK